MGAVICSTMGVASAFAVDSVTFLVSAVLIYRLPTPFTSRTSEPATLRNLINDVVEGWGAFWTISWYWRVALEFAVINTLVFAPHFVLGSHVAEESLGGSWAWAMILVGLGVGELIGAIIIPKRVQRSAKIALAGATSEY